MTARKRPADHVPLTSRTSFLSQKTGNLLLQGVEKPLAELGLNARTYFLLAGIDAYRGQPLSQQELSRLLGIDPTTMVALVDELERMGYVLRARNAHDRRRYDLGLTEAGERALDDADAVMTAVEREFFAPLTDEELGVYHRLSQRLLDGRWPPLPHQPGLC
jgi:DNA-binding MarR family transcriptional regulator